ncbi:MAG: DNA-binding transcriptional MocR family regulator [Ilumatobacter sp.]|jgi:DNA-binding transcriptional MocR family regulator
MRRHPSRELPLHADPTRRTIVLGPKAHELRAYVGSTAWAVLEEMMQRSTGHGEHVIAQISIRSLASSLGLGKDTVNRAVRRLRDLGVIDAVQARSESGVFEAGSYRLAVPVACISVACPSQPSVASSAARPSAARPSSAGRSSGQLSLLSEV